MEGPDHRKWVLFLSNGPNKSGEREYDRNSTAIGFERTVYLLAYLGLIPLMHEATVASKNALSYEQCRVEMVTALCCEKYNNCNLC